MTPKESEWLEALYQENFQEMKRYAQGVLRNEDIAEEIVQSTFCLAASRIATLMNHQNPKGWLMNVLKNKMKNHHRSERKDLKLLVAMGPAEVNELPDNEVDFCDLIEPCEVRLLGPVKDILTQEEYTIFRRIVLDKASYKTVAKELNISVAACYQRMCRIRNTLRKYHPEYKELGRRNKK